MQIPESYGQKFSFQHFSGQRPLVNKKTNHCKTRDLKAGLMGRVAVSRVDRIRTAGVRGVTGLIGIQRNHQ